MITIIINYSLQRIDYTAPLLILTVPKILLLREDDHFDLDLTQDAENRHSFNIHLGPVFISKVCLWSDNLFVGLGDHSDQEIEEENHHLNDVDEPQSPKEIYYNVRGEVILLDPILILRLLNISDRVPESNDQELREAVYTIIVIFVKFHFKYSILYGIEYTEDHEEEQEWAHVNDS